MKHTLSILMTVTFLFLFGNRALLYAVIYDPSWITDTTHWEHLPVYIGAELLVRDSTVDVTAKWIFGLQYLSKIYLMHPSLNDSAQFLFHNFPDRFKDEVTEINLGKFPEGTMLYFRQSIIDTSAPVRMIQYTGQNRKGIDSYISSHDLYPHFHACWSGASRVNEELVRVGFSNRIPHVISNVIFEVNNVSIGFIEKSKISSFVFTPQDTTFIGELTVSFDMHPDALLNILWTETEDMVARQLDTTIDTTSALDNPGTSLHYYYTLDGTDPRSSTSRVDYTAPFTISATTVVKAYAAIEGDTNWYPSEVVTRTYTKEGSTSIVKARSPCSIASALRNRTTADVFDISGRRIGSGFLRKGGVVIYRQGSGVFRQVVVR